MAPAAYDRLTVLALVVGGFVVPVLGWAAGVVLLWTGPRWFVAEKVVGTVAWPLGAVFLAFTWELTADGGVAPPVFWAALLVVGVFLAVVLAQLLRGSRRDRAGA